jgi:histidinol phosphatase-like enzyme (inositol monophosphatase family)
VTDALPPLEEVEGASLPSLLESAVAFALEAGEITLRHFGSVLAAESKSDGTPVTRADREAEAHLRSRIRATYPDHPVLGEEFGAEEGSAPVRWILDPIDGTRAFMRGVPLYGVLIGIEVRGVPAVGVSHFPALGETVAAAQGLGCRWWQGTGRGPLPAVVSSVDSLAKCLALTTDFDRVERSDVGPGWKKLATTVALTRGWGDAYGHILVATGRADVMVDPLLSSWDAAPLLPIVREAGGRFTDLAGDETIHGGSGVSTNGRLHAEVLRVLKG